MLVLSIDAVICFATVTTPQVSQSVEQSEIPSRLCCVQTELGVRIKARQVIDIQVEYSLNMYALFKYHETTV